MIALARKYRPKQFADLIVQDHVAAALRGAVAQGRVAHGYLFAGPRGVGKTTAARILAMALNCERPAGTPPGEPCGACDSCRRVWNGLANLDVVELDAASNRGVDDARDLRERAMYAASGETRSKVYIVDEAHMLTREAWNALLKILEEPPPRVVFVFATTEPQKIANTAAPILSRLQRFDFRRIGPHAIVARLKQVLAEEKLAAEDDALHLIAKSADGGMRDGLSLLDQVLSFGEGPVTAARVRDVLGLIPDDSYGEMLRCIVEHDAAAVFPLVDRLVEAGADLSEFVSGAGETLRALLLTGVGGQPEGLTERMQQLIRTYSPTLPAPDALRLLSVLSEMEERIRRGGNTRLAVELLLLRWAMADRTVALGEVMDALKGGGPTGGRPDGRTNPARVLRDVAPSTPPASARPPVSPSAPPEQGPLSLDHLRAVWPQIVADARVKAPMIGSLLAEATVSGVEGSVVTLRPAHAGHAEGLERQRELLSQVIARYVTEPVRVKLMPAGAGAAGASPERPARLTAEGANAERLKVLRGKDPTLNAAVDALDLELLE
ncbi:MAG TPA: DNA polymerase III subunit gamma/tau [Gemmatimonadales bacterium]|jgi:DNA polymerase-3 subunit gamma/tau|nr:DNA polymerase III subunit gamma/tau [Gemmatimonadales bacterium]